MTKLPDPKVNGNAGSFFKNPVISSENAKVFLEGWPAAPHYPQADGSVKLAAGWLIDQCQLKGTSVGGAAVHQQQALVLINQCDATSDDVVQLAHYDNTIPLTLISILADGEFHSGEQLGEQLGMSRAAINKHIQTLRDWGVDVFTVPGKGYSLPEPIQLLNEEAIRSQIGYGNVAVLPVIDSTNQYLLDRLPELTSGDACVAEYQQAGRGRRGRKWFSPFGANLYLSMYWRLEQGPAAAIGLSLVIGIVMAEVLHDLGADKVRVKWPNDLYLNDRKLAGILVELTGKTGDAAQIVIGAGLNMVMRNVQNDVVNQAWTNLQEAGIVIDRNTLAVRMIKELRSSLTLFEQEGLASFLSRWEKLDNFINRPVKLLIGDKEIYGTSRGIDAQGALLLEQDGVIKPWMGGEISLRSAE
ncbi:hypothetical protein L1887_45396 [Cichorium endivia]|nr:hypothetical protein L1887_45396 [Cichorium endivia]